MNLYRKAIRITGGIFLVYAVLVATHLGEFWPFSIYPMFSQAGNPWSRVVVRQVESGPEAVSWDTLRVDSLPGEPFTMEEAGVDPIDLASFITKTERWTPARASALQSLFRNDLNAGKRLMVMRVNGGFSEKEEVLIDVVPYVYVTGDTTIANPAIRVVPSSDGGA